MRSADDPPTGAIGNDVTSRNPITALLMFFARIVSGLTGLVWRISRLLLKLLPVVAIVLGGLAVGVVTLSTLRRGSGENAQAETA